MTRATPAPWRRSIASWRAAQRLVGLLDESAGFRTARQFTRGGRRSRDDHDEHTTASRRST